MPMSDRVQAKIDECAEYLREKMAVQLAKAEDPSISPEWAQYHRDVAATCAELIAIAEQ